ncbi:MAG: ATP-dependent DNA ligase [Acidimicrobiales bacterium]
MTAFGLAKVVETSSTVSSTQSRKEKVGAVADLMHSCPPDDTPLAVSLLAGMPRQGKIGVGWATLRELDVTPAGETTLTLQDVDQAFETLAATEGPGSTGRRHESLEALFRRATDDEGEFLKRVLLGELRQGANESLVLEGLAKGRQIPISTLRRALMLSGDLLFVAATAATAGQAGIDSIGLEVGRPLRPMLASTAPDVSEALAAFDSASVEWKLDGARVQIHRHGREVRIWTRNLNEITARLPFVVETVRSFEVNQVVLDGEILGFAEDEMPRAFQETMSSFGTETGAPELRSLFFDILHRDGRDLVDEPLAERRTQLLEVCGDLSMPGTVTDDPAIASSVLVAALESGHEGVMVKDSASTYEAGRRGKAWRKVKPVHTFDLVVLAAEWGHGRRTGWLSNLHLGARGTDGQFVMVGKTFKGLTDALLEWQTAELQQLQTHESGITVFVRPELVVEVAVDGVQASTRYPGGVALRFARVRRYRPDKSAADADGIESLHAMLAAGR